MPENKAGGETKFQGHNPALIRMEGMPEWSGPNTQHDHFEGQRPVTRNKEPSTTDIGIHGRFDPPTEEAYLDFKFNDSRSLVTSVTIAMVFLTFGLWIGDWTVDPLHAMDTLPTWILMAMIMGIHPVALASGMRRAALPWLLALLVLAVEKIFLYHLTLLRGGLVYGLSGFIYWYMLSVFTGLSFSITQTLLIIIAVALLPNILVHLGLAPNLNLTLYNALIWPTCFIAIFGNLSLDRFYRRFFRYRTNMISFRT